MTETIAQKAMEMGGRLRVKSALNPALWLCALITLPGMMYLGMANSDPPLMIQLIIALPVVVTCLGFGYLLVVDRDKLQSEDYQIRKLSLELVQEKGDKFPQMARTIEAINNPRFKPIRSQQEGDE